MSEELAEDTERTKAHVRAFRLIQDIQSDIPTAVDELEALGRQAEESGWGEVARAALFGRVVRAWYRRDRDARQAVAALIQRCLADADLAMLAVGLAMRADAAVSGEPSGGPSSGESDLARAVGLLEHQDEAPLERITGHTACGIALADRWLFELADAQYAAAAAIGAAQPAGSVDFLVAPVMFNRAELQLSWASILRQVGDKEGLAERWRQWRAAGAAATAMAMPEPWLVALKVHGLLLAAIAGQDTAAEARRLAERLAAQASAPTRALGHLALAVAVSDADAGRPSAREEAEQAVRALDPFVQPQVYDLALYLTAALEARGGARAGLRYGGRQLAQHWANRQASLGAMQARIDGERLSAERDVLSRHARLDDLTGIGNRRALDQYLAGVRRLHVDTIALILLDVNSFKEVNDRFGHLTGDAVLVRVGQTLQRGVRPSDLAVRLGGDEFAVVLAHADLETAMSRARDLVGRIDRQSFADIDPDLTIALSAGVAAGSPVRITELRAQADSALYRAKAGEGSLTLRSRVAPAGA